MGLAVFGVYVLDVIATPGDRPTADRNARALLAFEQWLHIDVEKAANHWLAPHRVLAVIANYEYAYSYVIAAFGLLVWLYVKFPADYRAARSSFIVLNLLGIACFALFPVTPPRLLPELGYLDTVSSGNTFGSWGTPLVSSANQLAAMPSLHVAWALWVSVVLAWLSLGVAIQIVSGLHVAVTVWVVIATANHFLVDAIAAIPFVWASVAVVGWHSARAGRDLVPSADSFFLEVETESAPQHVGGMVVLSGVRDGDLSLEQIRSLVRSELSDKPRFRQRPARSGRWGRWRWVDVAPSAMDWDWHISERVASPPGTVDDLEAATTALSRCVADLATQRMPRDRPMWRIVVVRGIAPSRAGLLFLVHHCVADGIGTVLHAMSVLRPRIELPMSDRRAPGPIRTAAAIAVGLAQLATDGRPAVRLSPGSAARQFAVTALDLETLRQLARRHDVRVTELLLALVGTALARTHPAFAAAVDHRLRVSVPVMLREPGPTAEGNLTAAALTDLPLHDATIDSRWADFRECGAVLTTPTRALASRFVMANVLGALPRPAQRWFARAVYGPAFLQAVVSNMPGSQMPMTIADAPLERIVPILPLPPDVPLAVGGLSWNGVLGLGLAADPEFLDANRLAAAIPRVLEEVCASDSPAGAETVSRHPPHNESRYGLSSCPATAESAQPDGSGGSTPARTDASRP